MHLYSRQNNSSNNYTQVTEHNTRVCVCVHVLAVTYMTSPARQPHREAGKKEPLFFYE